MALVSLEETKEYLLITSNNSDNVLQAFANYASKAVSSYCGREFESALVTEYHDGGTPFVTVNRPPINNVNAVAEYSGSTYEALTGPTDSEALPEDGTKIEYIFEPDSGLISKDIKGSGDVGLAQGPKFRNYKNGVKVEYNGGFDVIPDDLKMATLDYVKLLHKQEQGTSAVSFQGETKNKFSLNSGFPPQITRVLDFYKL